MKVLFISFFVFLLFTIPAFGQEEEEFINEDICEVEPESVYNEILARDPENVDAWYKLGLAVSNCGEYNTGWTYFDAAFTLDPSHEQAKKYRELIQQRIEDQKQAQEEESVTIELILVIGVGGGGVYLISWYYKKRSKKSNPENS